MMNILQYVVIMALGALATVLANKGIAVFNDGFRPIIPQFFDGKMSRQELAATSFAISFGLVIGFGIPQSIGATIILIHSILLATDIIGLVFKDDLVGNILAAIAGAIYGALILVGLTAIVELFKALPFNFLANLGAVSGFVVTGFAIFPAVSVGMQHGFKKGAITGVVTVLTWFIVKRFGVITAGSAKVTLNADGIAMLVGAILMLVFATQIKQTNSANSDLVSVFAQRVKRIQSNWWILAIMGGLVAAATSMTIVAGDPASLALLKEGKMDSAWITAIARGIGFIPLIFTTAIVTGVYSPVGTTFVFTVGILLNGNPLVAFIAGAVVMVAEIFLINTFAVTMDKFPGVRDMGEHIRTSMSKVLEIALLAGSVVAANAMVAGVGALFVIGVYLLNRQAKKPIVDLAVGPVAVIVFGILVNILIPLQLYVLPVVAK